MVYSIVYISTHTITKAPKWLSTNKHRYTTQTNRLLHHFMRVSTQKSYTLTNYPHSVYNIKLTRQELLKYKL